MPHHARVVSCGARTVACAALLLTMTSPLAAQEVRNSSYRAIDGTRVLQHEIDIPAAIADVWAAWTTTDGVRSWAVPIAAVDFRLGGIWESTYDPNGVIGAPGNIKNEFLAFIPGKMLTMQAVQAPPTFPHRELLAEIFTVVRLDSIGERTTHVTVSMVGYKAGERYDVIYGMFEQGNAWTLKKLHERFAKGPVDWRAVFAGDERPDAEKPGTRAAASKPPR